MPSSYLLQPVRSEAQARADIAAARARHAAEPARFRFYVSGYEGDDGWETYPVWAENADAALANARERCAGHRFKPTEVDLVPDAMTLPTGGAVLLDRDQARRIALCIALNPTNQKAA